MTTLKGMPEISAGPRTKLPESAPAMVVEKRDFAQLHHSNLGTTNKETFMEYFVIALGETVAHLPGCKNFDEASDAADKLYPDTFTWIHDADSLLKLRGSINSALLKNVESEVEKLKQLGWQREDFVSALKEILEPKSE